ncbi:carboxymuconolactone decarboxylase family protein [Alloalcanivorax marinus]|uniref:carboxymuconolactone decarboxylase family protein n=1 Tax=Alloalcanivorax marinus TaxID=1177169 RepID=UPI0019340C96|nr:carboxymuconolactone decarboxylase family protein [Alloalcanivorax marinus]MBL7250331.1 carboxymuconolactone decarboxylase family protein [Alloalcanivorax marinus]
MTLKQALPTALLALLLPTMGQAAPSTPTPKHTEEATMDKERNLTQRQQAIIPIAYFAAAGDLAALDGALRTALDTGMTVNDGKEVLVQLYAYAGFPRSLNALGTFMKVIQERRDQGIEDPLGDTPDSPIPTGKELLAQGTANQTKLAGQPVTGPLFEFAPAADRYLKTHLFGDVFARDNLSWRDRELATIAMLAALQGAEPQLRAHMGMAMNAGLTESQLNNLTDVLARHVDPAGAARARQALERHPGQ